MDSNSNQLYFGGPDLKENLLRDTLLNAIRHTPPGGEISWMCYYLNDRILLEALAEAAINKVNVTIILDASPRIPAVNQESIEYLNRHAGAFIKLVAASRKPLWEYAGVNWHPHFHSKVYYFSHPVPHVFIGSYNPTAGKHELPDKYLCEIGDHAISHNVLIDIFDPDLVRCCQKYLNRMQLGWNRYTARFSPFHNQSHHEDSWTIRFLPSLRAHPVHRILTSKDPDTIIRCAVSHLKGPGMMRTLAKALKHQRNVEILLDSTNRRVAKEYLSFLNSRQIKFHQLDMPEHCLMHNKFVLCESKDSQEVLFGSFNWSTRSRYLNHEVIISTTEPKIVNKFRNRWDQMLSVN